MATSFVDLPEDVLLQILDWLSPPSVVLVGSTCKQLSNLSTIREVWTTRLRQTCATRNVDTSIYDIESLTTAEVRDIILRPFHCISVLRARGTSQNPTNLCKSMIPFQTLDPSCQPSDSALIRALRETEWVPYMDPTGRFLVVTSAENGRMGSVLFQLWDLRTSPRSKAKRLGTTPRVRDAGKSCWVRGVFTRQVNRALEVIIVVFIVPSSNHHGGRASSLELYRFRILPQQGEQLECFATLKLTRSQGWGLARISMQGDLLLCYHRAQRSLIVLWNFAHNTVFAWDAPDNDEYSEAFFHDKKPYFVSSKTAQLRQYQLPALDAFTPMPSTTSGILGSIIMRDYEPESMINFLPELHADRDTSSSGSVGDHPGPVVEQFGLICRWHHAWAPTGLPLHFIGILNRYLYESSPSNTLLIYSFHPESPPDQRYQLFSKFKFDGVPDGFTFFEDDILAWRGVDNSRSFDYCIVRDFHMLPPGSRMDVEWKALWEPGAESGADPNPAEDDSDDSETLPGIQTHLFRIEDFVFQQQGSRRSALGWLTKMGDD